MGLFLFACKTIIFVPISSLRRNSFHSMTKDILDQATSALVAIENLSQLSNSLNGTISTVQGSNPVIPGIDPLISQAFRYGIIEPKDLLDFLVRLQDAVDAKRDELQKQFDSL